MKYVVFLPVFQEPIKEQRYMDIINNLITDQDEVVEVYKFVNRHPGPEERRCKTLRLYNERVFRKAERHCKEAVEETELLYFKNESLYRLQFNIWEDKKLVQSYNSNLLVKADEFITHQGMWKIKPLPKPKPLFTSTQKVAYHLV